jgi:hypothetical protein
MIRRVFSFFEYFRKHKAFFDYCFALHKKSTDKHKLRRNTKKYIAGHKGHCALQIKFFKF